MEQEKIEVSAANLMRVNEDRRRRAPRIVVNWPAVVTTICAFMVGMAVGMSLLIGIQQHIADAHGGLPHCTDAIADAGGVCWGEPSR